MLRCFERHSWLWSTHVWNMYDFAADARDQGGEPGMNHKGLVTFDRKTKKDSFYIYKAWWSDEPFVHICSKRFADRTQSEIEVKVYSNQKQVSLYVNGEKLDEQAGEHIFKFRVKLDGETKVQPWQGIASTMRYSARSRPRTPLQAGQGKILQRKLGIKGRRGRQCHNKNR